MDKKNLVFMGSSKFAVPILKNLLKGDYDVKAIYTKKDSLGGRGQREIVSPVKKLALDGNFNFRQPKSFKEKEEVEYLRSLNPDIIIVAAYGLILPKEVLTLSPLGCINVHPSLLPEYRGPSPIAASILSGDRETGVSIMLLDEGVDTGPILRQINFPIEAEDTTESLTNKLAELGSSLLVEILPDWIAGKIAPVAQDHSQASYTRIIKKEDGKISWDKDTARQLCVKLRAFYPWPGLYTKWRGKLLKILQAEPYDYQDAAGQVIEILSPSGQRKRMIGVGTREWVLSLKLIQYEGSRIMTVEEFARGHRDFVGSNLIEEKPREAI